MRSRRHRVRGRKLNLRRIEGLLGHVTATCLALLVICQLFLSHPLGRTWLPFIDAPEGQVWSAGTVIADASGWLTLHSTEASGVLVRVNETVVGNLAAGSLTLQVREGDDLLIDASKSEVEVTIRVSASYRVRFPARGAWIRVCAGTVVEWGSCQVYN